MKAARIVQPGRMEIVDIPCPEPASNEVLIRVMASGICGTDIHIFRGEYLGGYPVIPGHEFSGVVEAVGSQATRFKAGDRVAVEPNIACDNCEACLNNRQNFCHNWSAVGVTRPGAMEQFTIAPEKVVFDIGALSFEQAALMEPLSCVLHGLERLGAELADKVAILGAGPIGLLLLQGIRAQGASHVTVVDKNAARVRFAGELGAAAILTDLDALKTDFYDVVIDATGAIPVMQRTLDFVRPGGKVLLFGVPPMGKDMCIEPFKIFRKGLTVLSSYTSVRNSYQALDLLRAGRIQVDGLVSHRLPLEEFQHGIEMIEQGADGVKKVQILPNG
ncbi:MAG TPA: zinc-dependent alcohol dehydrogenase family protein [Anaerolineaceae bacterium]